MQSVYWIRSSKTINLIPNARWNDLAERLSDSGCSSFRFASTTYRSSRDSHEYLVSCSIVDDLFNRAVVDIYRSELSLLLFLSLFGHETLDEINHIIVDK